jgi:hypothetical protein
MRLYVVQGARPRLLVLGESGVIAATSSSIGVR